jgi:hypothetical protein
MQPSNKPNIPVNHTTRAWATFLSAIGVILIALQQTWPNIESMYPEVKWVKLVGAGLGFIWMVVQRFMDASAQNSTI